jgi:uncharacterized protein YjbJ (UPF0337 family)
VRLRICTVAVSTPEQIRLERSTKTVRDESRTPMGEIIDKVKGKVKRAVGVLVGDKQLERAGRADEVKGQLKGVVEDVKHAVKDAVKK